MDESWAPVASFLPHAEAWPLAGRLIADGIEAKVVRQPQSFYAYHNQAGGAMSVYMVLVRERDAARARWILQGVEWAREQTEEPTP